MSKITRPSIPRKISWVGVSLIIGCIATGYRWYYLRHQLHQDWNAEIVLWAIGALVLGVTGFAIVILSIMAKTGVGAGPSDG